MFKHLIALLILIILFTSSKAYSVEVDDLYQAKIPVVSQASKQRSIAINKAMQAVILKVGGQKSVLSNELIRNAVNQSSSYISQYHYEEREYQQQKQLFLMVSFNENKINELFHQANLAIWGSLRPQVLLWLIDENGFSRAVISNSSQSSLPLQAEDFSQERGLPLLLPLMDLDDASQITLSDLWGRFVEPIRQASARYYPEAIVVMRISDSSLLSEDTVIATDVISNDSAVDCGLLCPQEADDASYALDWTFITPKEEINQRNIFSQQYRGSNKSALLALGLADITDLIYQKYALLTSTNDNFIIEVSNINSLKQDSELVSFLADLSAVKSVTLIEAQGEMRRYSLALLGSQAALLASLKLNKQLKPAKKFIDPLSEYDAPQVPIFYWDQQ
ncbi:hypothetical protein GCM10009111_29730 [Colwellia asteriadis]|uniref:DUF2066 domain-containing protein n=1 Tax=Colwellia asteriadis TaxID=517723 RepID=A0ABN1LAP4_9GAMM